MDQEVAREIEESVFNYGYATAYHGYKRFTNPLYSNASENSSWLEGYAQALKYMKTDDWQPSKK